MLNLIFIKNGFTVSGWEGLIFKFSLLICLGCWHLLFPGLLTKNDFSPPPLSLWTFVHFHVKLAILFAFSMFTFFLFPHLHLAPGGTKAPPSLTQGVVLRACTFCILVGNNSQVHFFFHVRLCTFCIIVEHISKAQFRFQFGKELNLFLLKTSRNLPLYVAP